MDDFLPSIIIENSDMTVPENDERMLIVDMPDYDNEKILVTIVNFCCMKSITGSVNIYQ